MKTNTRSQVGRQAASEAEGGGAEALPPGTVAHTPGPWKVRKMELFQVYIPLVDSPVIMANPANALLIAAAPDLLEACAAIVAWCDKNPPMGDSLWCIQQARAAVKLATEGAV